jgi:hypothetical protein
VKFFELTLGGQPMAKKDDRSRMNPMDSSGVALAIAELAKAVKLLAGAHALPGGAVLNEVTELADQASSPAE